MEQALVQITSLFPEFCGQLHLPYMAQPRGQSALLAVTELGSTSAARGWRLRAVRDPRAQGSRPGSATASGARASRLPKSPIPPFLTLQVQRRAEDIYVGWYKHGTRTALPQTIAAAAILSASKETAVHLQETMGIELKMEDLTRVAGLAEGDHPYVGDKVAHTSASWLTGGGFQCQIMPRAAPIRPALADQELGPRLPAMGVFST